MSISHILKVTGQHPVLYFSNTNDKNSVSIDIQAMADKK